MNLVKKKSYNQLLVFVYSLFILTITFPISVNNAFIFLLIPLLLFKIVKEWSSLKISLQVWHFIPAILAITSFFYANSFSQNIIINHIAISLAPFILYPIYKDYPRRLFLLILIGSGLLASLVCYVNAFHNIISNNSWYLLDPEKGFKYYYLQYTRLSYYIHPIYLGLLINISVVAVLFSKLNNLLKILIVTYFGIFIILLSAKSIILCYFLTIFFYSLKRIQKLWSIGAILIILVASIYIISNSNYFRRINKSFQEISRFSDANYEVNQSSTAKRIQGLLISYDLIKDKPIFGYGAKSSNNIITNNYERSNIFEDNNTGIDGQYIEIVLMWGIVGLLLYLFYFYKIIYAAPKHETFNHALLLFPLVFSFIFESILDRQKGILGFVLITSFLLKENLSAKSDNTRNEG